MFGRLIDLLSSNKRIPWLGVLTLGFDQTFLIVKCGLLNSNIVNELVSQMNTTSDKKYGKENDQSGGDRHAENDCDK